MTNSLEDKRKGAEANRQKALERDAVILEWLDEGYSYAEIAEDLGVSLSTVRTVILRARRRAGIGPSR